MIAISASMDATSKGADDALARLEQVVHQLCCQYSTSPPGGLVRPAQRELDAASALFERRLGPPDARRLGATTGWLHLLLTCRTIWADPAALTHNPSRLATVRLDLGQVLLELGRLDEAFAEGFRAFESFPRRDTLVRARELDEAFHSLHPKEPQSAEFHARYVEALRSPARQG